jgi:hypothetical protein
LFEFDGVAVKEVGGELRPTEFGQPILLIGTKMQPLFIATEPFDPLAGDGWGSFIQWSGLNQLTELVSLDSMMCPSLLKEIKPDYWPHIVNESFMLHFFIDLPFLLDEISTVAVRKNLLCVFRNPSEEPSAPTEIAAFELLGYDLLDTEACASALSNCGGFPDVFGNEELTQHGLIASLKRANEIRTSLRRNHPEEHHADCDVWAIFRLQSTK